MGSSALCWIAGIPAGVLLTVEKGQALDDVATRAGPAEVFGAGGDGGRVQREGRGLGRVRVNQRLRRAGIERERFARTPECIAVGALRAEREAGGVVEHVGLDEQADELEAGLIDRLTRIGCQRGGREVEVGRRAAERLRQINDRAGDRRVAGAAERDLQLVLVERERVAAHGRRGAAIEKLLQVQQEANLGVESL